MSIENERRLILDMIENGKITADEGLGLLKALADSESRSPDEQIELLAGSSETDAAVDPAPPVTSMPALSLKRQPGRQELPHPWRRAGEAGGSIHYGPG